MKPMSSNDIRQAFIEYFQTVQHEHVASSPLPQRDNPTLLFTNAGMNQFANVFLGQDKRPYSRAVTSQKCMRVSGKHNDLSNVGPSPRHHTFFEMLGNFSFGDYFKKDAIRYAWEFLTEKMGLDKQRLWISIYNDDDEAFELWQAYVAPERILRFGKKENFWEMGDVGPCGPCSEIHYFLGDLKDQRPEGVNEDDDYLEIWNLVFMQFERDTAGNMTPLPRPSIDTGMGLERLTRVLQQADSNYDTDLFQPAMDVVQELLNHSDQQKKEQYVAYRVIADHVRAATFLISDGVIPGTGGAEYVLRMVIRRAARFGRELGFTEPFMAYVARAYVDHMGTAYPELKNKLENIQYVLTKEEETFNQTLDNSLNHLEKLLNQLEKQKQAVVPGDMAFDLYSTHGLPMEITRDLAEKRGMSVDEEGFAKARERHAEVSGSGSFKAYQTGENEYNKLFNDLIAEKKLTVDGVMQEQYGPPRLESTVIGLLVNGERRDVAKVGEKVELITKTTPFYVDSGGQVSDIGSISANSSGSQVRVENVVKPVSGLIVHLGEVVQGEIKLGDGVMLRVDNSRRADIRRNHTATHILHEELRRHLGKHVSQSGSLVAPDRLRFDFTHDKAVTKEQLRQIEQAVNEAIVHNYQVTIASMGQKEAIGQGAMALFGDKYGDVVRTVKIGEVSKPYSFELCGGLHVENTADIQQFYFTSEEAVKQGVRRVEAVTGREARNYVAGRLKLLENVAGKLNSPAVELETRVETLLNEKKALEKELEQARRQLLMGQFDHLLNQVTQIAGVNVLAAIVTNTDADGLRQLSDRFRDKEKSGVAILATVKDERPVIVATVTDDLIQRGLHAGNLVRDLAQMVGGGGGGKANMASAGGKDAGKLSDALASVPQLIEKGLKK